MYVCICMYVCIYIYIYMYMYMVPLSTDPAAIGTLHDPRITRTRPRQLLARA